MSALPFVLLALTLALVAIVLWVARFWRLPALTLFILALLAIIAEGPHAAAELWGIRTQGVIVATQESLRLDSQRAAGTRSTHYTPRHRYGATICYRLPGAPGLGAAPPFDPAIRTAIGESPGDADRLCHATPGQGTLRQAEIRLDAATHDATTPGRPATIQVLRPFGLLEWAWPIDAPLLPWLPRPALSSGQTLALSAEIVAVTLDTSGRTLLNRRAHDYAIPIAHVRLRYNAPGLGGVEGVDSVDAPAVATLSPGSRISITIDPAAPRTPRIDGASRSHWWRNSLAETLVALAIALVVIAGLLVYRRRRTQP